MKKLTLIACSTLLLIGFLIACKKKDVTPETETPVEPKTPVLVVKWAEFKAAGGPYAVSSPEIIESDSYAKILVEVENLVENADLLVTVTSTGSTNGTITGLDTKIITDGHIGIESFNFQPESASNVTYTFTMKVTLSTGEKLTKTAVITTEGVMTERPGIELGNQNSMTDGPFYNVVNGIVGTSAQGDLFPEGVDFVHFNDTVLKPTICAPAFATALTYYPNIAGWATKRATKFKKLAGFDYLNATFATIYAQKKAGGLTDHVKGLTLGDVCLFETPEGKFGIFQVSGVTGYTITTGSIFIDMKIFL